MSWAGLASVSVVTRARSHPVAEVSRVSITCTGREPKTQYHRQVMAAAWIVAVVPWRVTVTAANAASAASLFRKGQLGALGAGPTPCASAGRGPLVQGSVLAQPGAPGDAGGRPA